MPHPQPPTRQQPQYRSEGERRIAAALAHHAYQFQYERPVRVWDRGKLHNYRPDFYLPGLDLYIEYYGRVGNPDYDARTKRKQHAYANAGIDVIDLYPWDLCQKWPDNLYKRLNAYEHKRHTAVAQGLYRPRPSVTGYRSGPTGASKYKRT